MAKYIGKGQTAICMRSGIKCHASELVRDGRNPELLVLPEWADPAHPQERPFVPSDVEGVPRFPPSPDTPGVTPPVLAGESPVALDPSVELEWTEASLAAGPAVTVYKLYRDGGDGFELLGTFPVVYDFLGGVVSQTLEYIDTDVEAATTYQYKVVATAENGRVLSSNVLSVPVPATPTIVPPILVAFNNGDATIDLDWTAATGLPVEEYRLYRSPQGAGTYTLIYTGADLSFVDSVTYNNSYDYHVDAIIEGDAFASNVATVTASELDPFFDQVVVLMHANGANGGTSFVDSSSYARTLTTVVGGTTSTIQVKFGSASQRSAASSGGGCSFPDAAEIDITTNRKWTVEFWYYRLNGGAGFPFNKGNFSSVFPLSMGFQPGNTLRAQGADGSGTTAYELTGVDPFPQDAWTFVQLKRDEDVFELWYANALQATDTYSGDLGNQVDPAKLWQIGNSFFSDGWVDDFRMTMGVARPFMIPAAQFPDAGPS